MPRKRLDRRRQKLGRARGAASSAGLGKTVVLEPPLEKEEDVAVVVVLWALEQGGRGCGVREATSVRQMLMRVCLWEGR